MKIYRILRDGQIVESPFPGRFAGIVTQKIFGRLTCWSGKRALKKNRVFFHFWEDAIAAGFRPCKHCRPEPYTRADCDHRPFGPNGPSPVERRTGSDGREELHCVLCGVAVSPVSPA